MNRSYGTRTFENLRAYLTTKQSLIIYHQQLTINNHPQSCHAVSISFVAPQINKIKLMLPFTGGQVCV
ncbi:hypothetical protein FLJU110815_03855 [Flavobacterium jumunjinense]